MRVSPFALSFTALLLTGCVASNPKCDDPEVVSAVLSNIKTKAPRGIPHTTASDAFRDVRAENESSYATCESKAVQRLRTRLKAEFPEELRYRDMSEIALANRDEDICAFIAPTRGKNRNVCVNIFWEAIVLDSGQCYADSVIARDLITSKLTAIYETTIYTLDSFRFKGVDSQGTTQKCAATLHIAIPRYGESTRNVTYTVEKTTKGKPYVTVEELTKLNSKP